MTEYCRLAFHHEHDTAPVDGILYLSARNLGYTAVVLFANRDAVMGIEPSAAGEAGSTWLELVRVEHRELTVTDIEDLKSNEDRNRHNTDRIDFTDGSTGCSRNEN